MGGFRCGYLHLFGSYPSPFRRDDYGLPPDTIQQRNHRSFEVFPEYQELINELFTIFALQESLHPRNFLTSLRDASENKLTPLFQEKRYECMNGCYTSCVRASTSLMLFCKFNGESSRSGGGNLCCDALRRKRIDIIR